MRSRSIQLVAALALVAGLLLVDATPIAAASRTVRLEAGPHTGYRFSSGGTIVAHRHVTVSRPTLTATDRRRIVPHRPGIFLRITAGSLAGYEVRESAIAYIPGKAGDTRYEPSARIALKTGRYLGYTFDTGWKLVATRYGRVATTTTALARRRAVIDGRPYVLLISGMWSGTWMPVTAPRGLVAQRITCSVPAKPAAGPSVVLRRIGTDEAEVALTFDLGGRMTPALDILRRLVTDRVCATIFPTGDAAGTTTGAAILTMVKAHPELFEVGNHTMHHCNLRDGGGGSACPGTPATAARIQSELLDADVAIRKATGRASEPYWRPPYGAYDTRVRTAAAAVGYTNTVMWEIDTIDWRRIADGGPTSAAIANKVVTNARAGSVVLMHLGGYHTFDALPSMVLRLRAGGLQPSSISDLLR